MPAVSGSCLDIRGLAAFAALFLARNGDVPFSTKSRALQYEPKPRPVTVPV